MNELYFLLTFIILSFIFAAASVVAGFITGYKSEETEENAYECGMKTFGNAKIQFNVKFLNFAVMFLIFDVETLFLFPYAVAINEFDLYVLLEIITFVLIFLFGLYFAVKKNILRWK